MAEIPPTVWQGRSTRLDSIAIYNNPPQPIRQGVSSAKVVVELSGETFRIMTLFEFPFVVASLLHIVIMIVDAGLTCFVYLSMRCFLCSDGLMTLAGGWPGYSNKRTRITISKATALRLLLLLQTIFTYQNAS